MKTLLSLLVLALSVSSAPAFAKDRLKIITSADTYKTAIKFADSFAGNSSYNTPTVDSIAPQNLKNLFCLDTSPNSPEALVLNNRLPKTDLALCEKTSGTEISEIALSNKEYVYIKKSDAIIEAQDFALWISRNNSSTKFLVANKF